MPTLPQALSSIAAVCVLAGCSADAGPATAPAALARGGNPAKQIHMMDACDPTTFNAALGAGTCTRPGGVRFDRFLNQLGRHRSIGAWHFSPPNVNARVGQTLLAVNHGGEEHTFTEVEEFGGGMVPLLNDLSGNPVPAPECLALDDDDIVPPGGTYEDEVEAIGTERYQCCIHPWMRTVVTAKR